MQTRSFAVACATTPGLLQHALSFRARSLAWLLHRRQCACVAGRLRPQRAGEQPLSEVVDGALRRLHPACLESLKRKRFRNFMSFDRRWLEDAGSEDSHGRTLWALGECARSDRNASRRRWAAALFVEALPAAEHFRSPRAWAFTLLGLDAYCAAVAQRFHARALRHLLADRLMALLARLRPRTGYGSRKGWRMTTRVCPRR